MKRKNLHNELYKLAIAMNKYNNKGVKYNLDYLLNRESIHDDQRNNNIQLKISDVLHDTYRV
jgi:Mn-containing catalase